jgi:predicted acyl esterase
MSDVVKLMEERDIEVAMRDGTKLAVDVYRPEAAGKYPVLYASALHNKDIQGPGIADVLPPR